MALEDRVNQLENELKVLKNQIQNTLLDIREHLLNNTYSSLYSPSTTAEKSGSLSPHQQFADKKLDRADVGKLNVAQKYPTQQVVLKDETAEIIVPPEPDDFQIPAPIHAEPILNRPAASLGDHIPPKPIPAGSPSPPVDSEVIDEAEDWQLENQLNQLSQELADHNNQLDHFENLFGELSDRIASSRGGQTADEPLTFESLQEMMDGEIPYIDEREIEEKLMREKLIRETVCEILSWLDDSIEFIGKERTRQAIQIYARNDQLSSELSQILITLIDSSPRQLDESTKPSVRDVVDTLSKLNHILDKFSLDDLLDGMNLISEVHSG